MGNCFSSEKSQALDKPQSSGNRVPAAVNSQTAQETKPGELKTNYSMNNSNATPTNNNNNGSIPGSAPGTQGPNEVSRGSSTGSTSSPLSGITQGADANGTAPGYPANKNKNSSIPTNGNFASAGGNTTGSSNGGVAIKGSANGTTANGPAFPGNTLPDNGNRPEVKIMLMGSGESGKSTILKQMKIIHQNGYSQDDLLMYKTTIYKNLLDCAKAIVNALQQFEIDLNAPPASAEANLALGDVANSSSSDATVVNITGGESAPTDDTPENSESKDASNSGAITTTHSTAIPFISDEELELIQQSVISADLDSTLDTALTTVIAKLWAHPYVKDMYRTRRSQFYIMDSASYFFNNVQRIGDIDYIPNVADILRARIKTTGIYETRFQMGRLNIHMYDVGGQRSERKKWIHCFDDVTLIIFCVALSEYDQVLLEETTQNRMAESLVLFDSIINSRWFVRTSVVLFLNKIDVFTEKLPLSPLENYFKDYTGGPIVKNAAKYILWRFTKLNRNNLNIYPHITQATDTSNIRLVFAAVKETILQNSLRDSGLL